MEIIKRLWKSESEQVKTMLQMYLHRLDANEQNELEVIYQRNKDILYNIAYRILYDEQLSEDAVHEAFLSAALNLDKIRGQGCIQIRKYLIIIVRNASYRIYNKRKKEVVADVLPNAAVDITDLEIDIENKDSQERLHKLIKSLDVKYADVLELKYFFDLKDKEIAKALGISLENVKIRLVRGKRKIKELLEENADDRITV